MGLFDFFKGKPARQNDQKEKTIEPMQNISNEKYNEKTVALETNNNDHKDDIDEEALKKIAMGDGFITDCKNAIERINNENILKEVALNAESIIARRTAVEKIKDEAFLKEIACNNEEISLVRVAAIEKITNEEYLYEIFLLNTYWHIRIKAVEMITDEAILQKAAIIVSEREALKKEVETTNDESFLKEVVSSTSDNEIRWDAVDKITDETFLRELLNDSNEYVRKVANEKLATKKQTINSPSSFTDIEEEQLIPCLKGEPNFHDGFKEISFSCDGISTTITVNRDGVLLRLQGYKKLIPFSEIVNIKWQPILRPEIAVGGWVKIITSDNYICPKLIGYDFRMPESELMRIYPSDNCFWYNATDKEEATERDEKVKNILKIIQHIIGLKEMKFKEYLGSGICSVCKSSINNKKAYDIHYDEYWPKRFKMSDAIGNSALTLEKALAQTPNYIVCEKCIHNFE